MWLLCGVVRCIVTDIIVRSRGLNSTVLWRWSGGIAGSRGTRHSSLCAASPHAAGRERPRWGRFSYQWVLTDIYSIRNFTTAFESKRGLLMRSKFSDRITVWFIKYSQQDTNIFDCLDGTHPRTIPACSSIGWQNLKLNVQVCAPDNGRRKSPKYVQPFTYLLHGAESFLRS